MLKVSCSIRFVVVLPLLVFWPLLSAWADDCGTDQKKKMDDADVNVTVTLLSPTQAPASTAVVVTITGTGLNDRTLVACPRQAGASEIVGLADPQHPSDGSGTSVRSLMSLPDVSGIYDLYLLEPAKSAPTPEKPAAPPEPRPVATPQNAAPQKPKPAATPQNAAPPEPKPAAAPHNPAPPEPRPAATPQSPAAPPEPKLATTGEPASTDKPALINLNRQFVVSSSDDTKYVNCGFANKAGSKNSYIGCSFVPLSYKATQQIFGKAIADRFIVVQVTVRNKNTEFEYLLQDIKLGTIDSMVASLDKKLARRVAENGEQFSARAISFRLVEAGATVLTGIAGVVGNDLLKDAANLVAGPAQTGFRGAIPDLSTAEINSVSDNGFSVTSTVIPKNSAIAVVAFLSSDNQTFTTANSNYKHLKGEDLLNFQKSLDVQVAGIHIQQVETKPTLKAIVSQDKSITGGGTLPASGALVVLQGTALNEVDSVSFELEQSSSQTAAQAFKVKLTPHNGKGTLDPTIDDVLIPQNTVLHAGDYLLSLIATDGTTIPTTVKMTVPPSTTAQSQLVVNLPPSVTSGSPQQLSVTVNDASGKANAGFTGTVHFAGGGKDAVLPKDYTFNKEDKGTHQFSVTFKSKGNQTLTVTSDGVTTGTETTTVN